MSHSVQKPSTSAPKPSIVELFTPATYREQQAARVVGSLTTVLGTPALMALGLRPADAAFTAAVASTVGVFAGTAIDRLTNSAEKPE